MAKISINMKSGEIEKKEIIIGIDLGTTNSLVAYLKDGEVHIVKDENGNTTLVPSIIHFGENNEIVVGNVARENLIASPERTIYSVKRLLGKSYADIAEYQENLAYEIIDQEDQLVKVKIGNTFYSPVSLSAEILKYLKTRVESELNQEVSKAVITVPAYFNDAQRQATRDAGKIAGLDVLRIVNEPTAASLAYGVGKTGDEDEIVAVYDLGGGTFDISILRIENGIFDVMATHGDTFLGGDDFDRAIINYWIEKNKLSIEDIQKDNSLAQTLRLRAEEAKKHLSSHELYSSEENFSISKQKFESLIGDFVEKTIDKFNLSLKDAGLKKEDIDKIILVGGSTRVPLIKNMLKETFGRPIFDDLNPDEVVAVGAAIQADILAGNTTGYLLIDVNPLSLGIETIGGLMDTIIGRNSKVPISAGRQYTTSVDGQKNLKISVYQGERELVEHNRKLGEFVLSDIPPMPAGIPKIEVQFIIDADGILKVKAMELRSGKIKEVKIKSQYGISEEEMGRMLLESIKNAESDMAIRSLLEAKNEANAIALSADKFIVQNHDILSSDEIATIKNLLDELKSKIRSGDKDALNLAMKTFNDYSEPLAERAMDHNIKKALAGKKL